MLISRANCPECDRPIKPAKPLPAGTKVKCPRCAAVFALREPDDKAQDEPEPVRSPRPARRGTVTPDEDDEPPARKTPKKRRKRKAGRGPALGLVLGGIAVLVIGGGIGLYFLIRGGGEAEPGKDPAGPAVPAPVGVQAPAQNQRPGQLLVGIWDADLRDGGSASVEYRADGTMTVTMTTVDNGKPVTRRQDGTWQVVRTEGKGLWVHRVVGGFVHDDQFTFPDDDHLQTSASKGVFRRRR